MGVQAVCSTTVALTIISLAMQSVTSWLCLSTGHIHVLLITSFTAVPYGVKIVMMKSDITQH